MHVAEGAVHIGLVLRLNVRHAALVVAHADRRLQVVEVDGAIALRLFAVEVPPGTGTDGGNSDDQDFQAAFHPRGSFYY